MTHSHYDTLGVPRDADEQTIKRAYRKQASEHHPDRGEGDTTRMQAVNAAYACLSDPQRRLHYDRTGNDDSPEARIEKQATQMIVGAFAAALEASIPRDLVGAVTNGVKNRQAEIAAQIEVLRRQQVKLEGKRDRVRAKTGANLYQQLIDGRIAQIASEISNLEAQLLIIDKGLDMLMNYESNDPVEQPNIAASRFNGLGSFGTASTWWQA